MKNPTSISSSMRRELQCFLKLIFFISIIFVILLIIIASIIYIWVIRKFSTNLEQVNRRRLPEEVNHNLLNHSIQDFEALMLSVQNLGCAGMERLGSPPSNFAASCSPQRDNRSIRRPTNIPIMKHDLKVSSNRQPQQNNNSTKAQHQQQLQQQSCYNNLNSGINNNTFSTPHQQQHLSADGNHHRNNHQYTSCAPSMHCPVHIQNPQHDGEFSRRIPSVDQCNDEIRRTYIQGPPNKTIQDVPDASDSHLPAYALRYNNHFCNNNLSNQKPSNSHNHHNNSSSNSSGGSSQCRSDKMRKTSSNFILDKLKFLRANSSATSTSSSSSSTNVKSPNGGASSVDFKATATKSTNNPMVHSTFPITSMSAASLASRCATQSEESTERNLMFNGSTNLQVSSSSESSRSLLSQTSCSSSDCADDTINKVL